MSTVIGASNGPLEKIMIGVLALAMIALFAALTQPAWRGEEMVAELKSDCDKRGGVMLEHQKTFGISYECASRLD